MIKKIIFGLTAIIFSNQLFAQLCKDADILPIKTKWKFEQDAYMLRQPGLTSSLVSKIFKNTNEYKSLFTSAYPQPYGGIIRGFGYIPQPSIFDIKGHQAYEFKISYFGYHCNKAKTEIVTDPNYLSSSNAAIRANDLSDILKHVTYEFELEGKPIRVFQLAHRLNDLRGFMQFAGFRNTVSGAVLITHEEKLPYRFLTRREYLTIIKTHWQKEWKKGLASVDEEEKRILGMIEKTKKEFTGDMREAMLKDLNIALEQARKRKEPNKKRMNADYKKELDSIDFAFAHYSEDELKMPAIPKAEIFYRGFITEKEGGHYLVVLNESYFRNNLSPYAAQTLVLRWDYNDTDPGAIPWLKAIRDDFPFDKLKTLIDK